MTTVREVIAAAHRKIAVLGQGENMPASMASDGLFAFNAMLHGWKADGVDVEHADQELTSTFSLGPEFLEGTVYLLAQRLGPDYLAPRTFDHDSFMRRLQAAYYVMPEMTIPTALTNTPAREDRDGNLPFSG
ncbi:MAG: hypothetical protein ACRBB0_15250 [Pelagimonas sp.]|uniref:hypothetical protein n=1 Tax=Pelagimonas sp. TaxID=2073170 RepID=UPI003D6A2B08